MSRSPAYRLIDAWPLAERLSPMGDKLNERQVRELLLPGASRTTCRALPAGPERDAQVVERPPDSLAARSACSRVAEPGRRPRRYKGPPWALG